MKDPFKIDGPTVISFSGGRSSGYMLWRVLQAHGGKLPPEAKVCFANTGKENEATLRFVRDVSVNWNVPIVWLEYRNDLEFWGPFRKGGNDDFAVVDFDTASRNGEPFEALIMKRNYLPNPVARFCTVELKILTAERYLKSIGWTEWDDMVGVRADEPVRVAKIRANPSGGRSATTRIIPLADIGINKGHVGAFWKQHPFDLELPNHNGVTMEGNCDLCFLKGAAQIVSLISKTPQSAVWWARVEGSITNAKITNGGRFRSDRPSYAQMADFAAKQIDMFDHNEEAISCFCGD